MQDEITLRMIYKFSSTETTYFGTYYLIIFRQLYLFNFKSFLSIPIIFFMNSYTSMSKIMCRHILMRSQLFHGFLTSANDLKANYVKPLNTQTYHVDCLIRRMLQPLS